MEERINSFDAVCSGNARILILGTMPSVESLKQAFYYAHPRNAFWPMLADIYGEPAPLTPPEKVALLNRRGLALWDVARSCVREGSLDSAIKFPEPNDIGGLLAQHPSIGRILFNGGTAFKLYKKLLGNIHGGRELFTMPSTSPAYTLPYAQKMAVWKEGLCGDKNS